MKYKWIDDETGEIRTTIWRVIIGDIQDAIYVLTHGHKIIKHKWKYNRKGW